MTVSAGRLGVGTRQSEAGKLAVVKGFVFPVLLGVAAFTFLTEACVMHILQGVAVITSRRYAFVDLTDMAAKTGRFCMGAIQLKPGLAVIELRGLFPVRCVVT